MTAKGHKNILSRIGNYENTVKLSDDPAKHDVIICDDIRIEGRLSQGNQAAAAPSASNILNVQHSQVGVQTAFNTFSYSEATSSTGEWVGFLGGTAVQSDVAANNSVALRPARIFSGNSFKPAYSYGMQVTVPSSTGGVWPTTTRGVFIENQGQSTVTTATALYIEEPQEATNKQSIEIEGGKFLFNTAFSDSDMEFRNSDGENCFLFNGNAAEDLRIEFNTAKASNDFNIRGVGETNLFFVDTSADTIGMGTGTPATSAKLDITSTTGAVLFPRMTTAQRDALTAVDGMQIYNTNGPNMQVRNNGVWEVYSASSSGNPGRIEDGNASSYVDVVAVSEKVHIVAAEGTTGGLIDMEVNSAQVATINDTAFQVDVAFVAKAASTVEALTANGDVLITGTSTPKVTITSTDATDAELHFEVNTTGNHVDLHLDESMTDDVLVLEGHTLLVDTEFHFKALDGENAVLKFFSGANEGRLSFNAADVLRLANRTQDKDIIFEVNDGGVVTDLIRLDASTSRVGIGVAAPANTLEVQQAGTGAVVKVKTSDADSQSLIHIANDVVNWAVGADTDDSFLISEILVGNRIRIAKAGNMTINDDQNDWDTIIESNNGATCFYLDAGNDNITINGTTVSANYDLGLIGDGVLMIKETSTPTADTNNGKVYCKSDNKLYFQDGAGTEHEVAFV